MLMGIVSAGLVGFLSNTITATIEVKGPIFYPTNIAFTQGSEEYYELIVNSLGILNVDELEIVGGKRLTFRTSPLSESISFYRPQVELSVEAMLKDGSPNKNLTLEFGYLEEHENSGLIEICSINIEVDNNEIFKTYDGICSGNGEISELKEFYYRIEGESSGDVIIRTNVNDEKTKAKILGVAI